MHYFKTWKCESIAWIQQTETIMNNITKISTGVNYYQWQFMFNQIFRRPPCHPVISYTEWRHRIIFSSINWNQQVTTPIYTSTIIYSHSFVTQVLQYIVYGLKKCQLTNFHFSWKSKINPTKQPLRGRRNIELEAWLCKTPIQLH